MASPLARHIVHEGLRGLARAATFPVAEETPMRSRYEEAYTRSLRDPEAFWAAVAEDIYWERRWDRVLDDSRPPVLPLVCRRRPQHVLQRPRPAHRSRPRQAAGPRLRQPRHRHDQDLHLLRAARRGRPDGRRAAAAGHHQGRPGHHLHADGAGGGHRHAGLRAHRRGALGGVRRLRLQRARQADRRRQAAADPVGVVRDRGQPRHCLQAAARRRDRAWPPTRSSAA